MLEVDHGPVHAIEVNKVMLLKLLYVRKIQLAHILVIFDYFLASFRGNFGNFQDFPKFPKNHQNPQKSTKMTKFGIDYNFFIWSGINSTNLFSFVV